LGSLDRLPGESVLLKDRLRTMLLGGAAAPASSSPAYPNGAPLNARGVRPAKDAVPYSRQSNGLEQFFSAIRELQGLDILDFAEANQSNVSYITSLGHRIYSEDFLRSLDTAFGGPGDFYSNQADPNRSDLFVSQMFDFPDNHFDGALVWDSLQYLGPTLLQVTVDRLARAMRPGAYMLALFHADEKAQSVPVYSYRISDARTLSLSPRGHRKPAQFFNNRGLERLFQGFQSVKFFLTRDSLREIIVRR
jgi:hypothetical protein